MYIPCNCHFHYYNDIMIYNNDDVMIMIIISKGAGPE